MPRRFLWVLCWAPLLAACPSTPGGEGADAGLSDGAEPDPCADRNDAGPRPDSGVLTQACDPTTGARCNSGDNESCVWSVEPDQGECRCVSATARLGEACQYGRVSCGGGLTCLPIRPGVGAECWQVCALRDADPCASLSQADPGTSYECFPVGIRQDAPVSSNFGICYPLGTRCDPLADLCPADEVCELVGTQATCGTLGTRAIGEGCQDEGCARGGLCTGLTDQNGTVIPPTCYEACTVGQNTCTTGQCANIGLSFGLCL